MQAHRSPNHALLGALALALGLGVSACTPAAANPDADAPRTAPAPVGEDGFPAGPYGDRDPALAKQLVDGGALLIDVRTPEEFASGHIDGAINISHTDVAERLDEIREQQGGDAHKPIVLYCRSGQRASVAKRELEAAGFDRITNLGSIRDWPG